jgi:single-strand DNA-binding protein
MANELNVTIVGTLTADPELRTTGSGASVANFTIAHNERVFDQTGKQWKDGAPLFLRCSCWRGLAEHAAQSLGKGLRVIAQGRLRQRSYQTQDGQNRTVIEMSVEAIGPDLRYVTAQVYRVPKGTGRGFAGRGAISKGAGDADDRGQQPIPLVGTDPFSQAQAADEFGGDDDDPEF